MSRIPVPHCVRAAWFQLARWTCVFACLFAPIAVQAAFSLTSGGGSYTVDTNAGLVFKVNQSNGDITSLVYNGIQYQYSAKGSHINSGLGTTGVTVTGTTIGTDYIKITVTAPANAAGGTLTHYYLARKGYSHIYMATHFTDEPDIGLVRFIVRIPNNLLPNGPVPSDIRNNTGAIEASDIYGMADGTTRSKHYSNMRLKDWAYTGATGTNVAAWMVRSTHEGGSSGPFYRCLINQCGDQQELYEILNYGEAQTEPFRFNILNGPYTLVFTNGGTPPALDTSWVGGMGLTGYVAPADRGAVTCASIANRDASYSYTVGFSNANAQYWAAVAPANGSFTTAGMIPGTYTMRVYKNELTVYTASVTVTAGATTTVPPVTINADPSTVVPLWRIGNWDGTPTEFLNGDKITTMHPSDVRMASWAPGPFVVGSSVPGTGMPCYQWKDIAGGSQTIQFSLTSGQISASTIRVGITCANAGARPNIGINSWTSGLQSPSTQPTSRTLTVGTYRGNNVTYTFSVPASALQVGINNLYVYPISGSSSAAPFLSPGYSVDCVELYQGAAQTLAIPGRPGPVTASGGNGLISLSWPVVPGAANYSVLKSPTAGGPYTKISDSQTTTGFTDTGLLNGVTYYYLVNATNSSGTGLSSDETAAAATVAPGTPPVARLTFDEASGTLAGDSSGNDWNGTLMNGPARVAGRLNNAVNLTTANHYVKLPAAVTSALNDVTISSWVKLNTATNWARLFDFGTGTNNYLFLAPTNSISGKLRFAIRTPTVAEQIIDGTGPLATGTWIHVAVTLSGSTGTLYVNGGAVGSNSTMTLKPSSLGSTTQNYIGKSQFAADPNLSGAVDDFQIFNRALNGAEIASLASPPAEPEGLAATAGDGSARLSWTPVTGSHTSYCLRRSSSSAGPFMTVASGISGTSYTDGGLTNGMTYHYSVSTLNGVAESSRSASVAVTPLTSPTGLLASGSYDSVALTWNAALGATSYKVKRSAIIGGPYSLLASDIATNSYTDLSATPGTTYYYVVSSSNPAGESENSAQAAATVRPSPPTGLAAVSGSHSVNLSWNLAAGATGYSVLRSETSGANYVSLAVDLTETSYQDLTASNGVTYYYVVTARNAGGDSLYSTQVSATPSSIATVTLGNLAANYDGSPKPISVTTSPAGLAVSITYAGDSMAPTAPGTYPVVATVTDADYTGSASGNLVITRVPISITWTGAADANWNTATPNWAVSGSAVVYQNGDSVSFTDAGSSALSVNLPGDVQPASVIVDAAANYSVAGAGAITGSTSLMKLGSGTLVLSSAHNYTGSTTIQTGTLQIGDGGTSGSIAATNGITNHGILAFNRSGVLSVATAITGSGGLTKLGTGELVLTGANNSSGTTTVVGGKLSLGSGSNTNGIGSGPIVLTSGVTLRLNSSVAQTISNPITLSGADAAAILTVGSISSGFNGAISGLAGQTLIAGGTTQMSLGASTQQLASFAGTLDIPSGATVRFSTTAVTAHVGGAAATFNVNGFLTARNAIGGTGGIHLGALTGAGSILGGGSTTVGTNLWIVGEKNLDTTFAGSIANGLGANASLSALNKLGSGTLTLTGTSTYTGPTTVTAGKLVVNGALGNTPTTVAAAAALGGSGSIGNTVTCNGTLAPGATAAGALTLSGSLNLTSTSTLQYDLGTSSDHANVGGALVLDGTVNVTALPGFGTGSYTLIAYGGSLTNNGLEIGTLPPNCTGAIDLTTAGQVKLVIIAANSAPQVVTGPTAAENPVTTTATDLTVTALDDGGEASLTYAWSATGPGAVVFSVSGNNGAKNTTATFSAPGSYLCKVTVSDAQGSSTQASAAVEVTATATRVVVSPASASLAVDASQAFSATVRDQFENVMSEKFITWSVDGGGSISGEGMFTATTAGGPYVITGTSGSLIGAASVTVSKAPATVELSGSTAFYDGVGKSITVVTSPPDLSVSITYNGSTALPITPGNYAVAVTVTSPNYFGSGSGEFIISPRTFSNWLTLHFTANQIAGGEADMEADPDHDGLSNLAEYALGADPNHFTAQPAMALDASSQSITFQRPAYISDVTYHAQFSSSLTDWSELTLEVLNPGNDPETVRASVPLAIPRISQGYLRLGFSQ